MYITISEVMARILGIIFVVLGLSMAFNKKFTAAAVQEMMQNKGLLWLGGLIALSMGAVIVALNNIWTWGLPLVITIMGWMSLLKGLLILVFPNSTISLYKKINNQTLFIFGGIAAAVFGLVLVYMGWV